MNGILFVTVVSRLILKHSYMIRCRALLLNFGRFLFRVVFIYLGLLVLFTSIPIPLLACRIPSFLFMVLFVFYHQTSVIRPTLFIPFRPVFSCIVTVKFMRQMFTYMNSTTRLTRFSLKREKSRTKISYRPVLLITTITYICSFTYYQPTCFDPF